MDRRMMHPPVCIANWLQRTRQDPETKEDYQRAGARTVTNAQQLTANLVADLGALARRSSSRGFLSGLPNDDATQLIIAAKEQASRSQ
jgi:hypothetical protein